MEFSNNLKRLRTNAKLTQNELALKMGVSSKTISSWEVGRTEPSMGDIATLCKFLNCTQGELIGNGSENISVEDILNITDTLNLSDLTELSRLIQIQVKHRTDIEKMERELAAKRQRYKNELHSSLVDDDMEFEFIDL